MTEALLFVRNVLLLCARHQNMEHRIDACENMVRIQGSVPTVSRYVREGTNCPLFERHNERRLIEMYHYWEVWGIGDAISPELREMCWFADSFGVPVKNYATGDTTLRRYLERFYGQKTHAHAA